MDLKSALPVPVRLKCSKCSEPIEVRTFGLCRSVVCARCSAVFKYDPLEHYLTHQRTFNGSSKDPFLRPGDEGILLGRRYLVTGWVVKKEVATSFQWTEFHLFNPVHGFAQLSMFDGHWTFHEAMRVYPRPANINDIVLFERNAYEVFNTYQCRVLDAAGEFTEDPKDQEYAKVREFIAPPYMLTRELRDNELTWYQGRYVEPADVKAAFAKSDPLPLRSGVGACQPMRMAIPVNALKNISVWSVGLFVLTQLLLAFMWSPKVLFQGPQDMTPSAANEPLLSRDFHLDGWRNGIEVFLRADGVDNSWFELAGVVVNNATGESRKFNFNVEYYHGYEGGENWKEGGVEDGIVFSHLPAGDYHLEMYPTSDPNRRIAYASIMVEERPRLWSNFFFLLVLSMLFPLIVWWRHNRFETARWGE